jgi:hypothetical protein
VVKARLEFGGPPHYALKINGELWHEIPSKNVKVSGVVSEQVNLKVTSDCWQRAACRPAWSWSWSQRYILLKTTNGTTVPRYKGSTHIQALFCLTVFQNKFSWGALATLVKITNTCLVVAVAKIRLLWLFPNLRLPYFFPFHPAHSGLKGFKIECEGFTKNNHHQEVKQFVPGDLG